MADPVWYYARGDVEKGPLSSVQIKALAAAGRIRPDDYVWKEGMDNWLPAGEVKELFPAEDAKSKDREPDSGNQGDKSPAPDKKEKPGQPRVSRGAAVRKLAADPQKLMHPASRIALLVGILSVVFARGCDSIGARYAARLRAISVAAESRFKAEWEQRRQELQQQRDSLQADSQLSQDEQKKLQELAKNISLLDGKMQTEEARLRASRWREMETDAKLATESNRMWGFWRELLFQLGTLLLAFGLVTAAHSNDGPERWICLIVLAVIVYSVFNGQPPPEP